MVISKLINIWMGWDTCSRHLVSNSKILMHCENESESRIWLFAAPWTTQSVEFSRPEYWRGWPFPSPGDLPNPGIEPRSPTLQADSLPAEPPGKPINTLSTLPKSKTVCLICKRGLSPQIHSQLSTEHRYLPDLGNPACVEWSLQTFNKLTGVMNTAKTCHLKSAPPCPPHCSWWGLAQWGQVGALCLQTDVTGWDCNLSEALLPHYK